MGEAAPVRRDRRGGVGQGLRGSQFALNGFSRLIHSSGEGKLFARRPIRRRIEASRRTVMSEEKHSRDCIAPPRPTPGGARDEVDYGHRHFVNLLSVICLLVLALAMVWTFKALDEYETLRKCVDSGRKDCVRIDAPKDMRQAVR